MLMKRAKGEKAVGGMLPDGWKRLRAMTAVAEKGPAGLLPERRRARRRRARRGAREGGATRRGDDTAGDPRGTYARRHDARRFKHVGSHQVVLDAHALARRIALRRDGAIARELPECHGRRRDKPDDDRRRVPFGSCPHRTRSLTDAAECDRRPASRRLYRERAAALDLSQPAC